MARATTIACLAIAGVVGVAVPRPTQAAAQQPLLRVGPDTPVSGDAPGLTHVEPHLSVNPAAPAELVTASIVFRDGIMTSDVLRSDDGGASWTRTPFPACAGDPWVVWGSRKNVYFSCLAADGVPVGVLVFRSDNGGRSWLGPVEVPRGGGGSFDHTALAVQPRLDTDDLVYIAGMQGLRDADAPPIAAPFVAVSTDGANTFAPAHRIVFSNVMANTLNPVVLGPGRMGVAFVDFSVDGRRPIEHRRLWWVHSGDRGRSFSLPHLAAETAGMRTIPIMSASPGNAGNGDPSARVHAARVYMAWDDVHDDRQGIFFAASDDDGVSWSAPVSIAAGDPDSFHAENPVTAVDATGNVGVAWYQRPPNAPAGCWRIRFTLSTDGGAAFADPVTVSSEPFCARAGEVAGAGRWRVGGDYFGLAAVGEGVFRVLWADSRTGVWQVRTAVVGLVGQ